jgi:amidase
LQPRLAQLSRRELVTGAAVVGAGAIAFVAGRAAFQSGDATPTGTVQFATETTPETAAVAATPPATPGGAVTAPATATATGNGDKIDPATILERATLVDLRSGMTQGNFTAVELMDAVLARIEMFDRVGPELGAVIEIIPNARDLAQEADDHRAAGMQLGLLHGIPILVKDIIATQDATRTTAGSYALEDNIVVQDSFLVAQLRKAGAIVLGKANLTEWSNFKGDGGASGWSPRGGQTRNPYNPELSPSGSSSGSAVSVAAGYVAAAIGSETNGSIIAPAAVCGVVGFKPTTGLISRAGVIPLSLSQDAPGPMVKTVEDAAIMLSVLAGYDPDDILNGELADYAPAAQFDESPIPEPGTVDYTRALDPDALKGARIGVCRTLFGFEPEVDLAIEETLQLMADAGADIVEEAYIETFQELDEAGYRYTIYTTEFKEGLKNYLATYTPDGPIEDVGDVVAYNEAHPDLEFQFDGESPQYALIDAMNAEYTLESPEYRDLLAQHSRLARQDGIDAVMDDLELDVMVAPTAGLPMPINDEGDVFSGASSLVTGVAGYPSITIPVGDVDGLPIGIHIFGRAFSEETILAIAYATERIVPNRKPPRL